MGVIASSVKLQWSGSDGSWSLNDNGNEYQAHWHCDVDDPLEQAATVIEYFNSNVRALGSIYNYASDLVDTSSILKKITASRDLGSTDHWIVVMDYGPEEDDDGEDPEGDPTQDPLEFAPVLTWQTQLYEKPVERAEYVFGFKGTKAAKVEVGK